MQVPAQFEYVKATSVDDAIAMLTRYGPESFVVAGGHSLLPMMKLRLAEPETLIDINGLDELATISVADSEVRIGAMVRHNALLASPVVAEHFPIFGDAERLIADPVVRNRGTVGGSVAFADPAAELPACLLALGGEMEIVGPAGRRALPADEFFRGLYETALSPRDVLTAVRVPVARAGQRFGFAELARRHGDYALVGLAAATTADGAGRAEVRLAWFAAGATALRTRKAELALASRDVEAAVAALADELDPPDDVHASGTMRKHLAGVLLRRVAAQLLGPEP